MIVVARLRLAFLARVVRPPTVDIVGIFRVEVVLQLLGLVEVELLLRLICTNEKWFANEHSCAGKDDDHAEHKQTISIEFHSLLRILLTSPVRIIWLAAEIWGRRFRAKIMNAFIGRFGVPSAFNVWDVRAWYGSSRKVRGAAGQLRVV